MDIIYGITGQQQSDRSRSVEHDAGLGRFLTRGRALRPGPRPRTLIDGTFRDVAGAGAYAFINNLVYVELTGYRTSNFKTLQAKLGVDPFGMPGPYPTGWAPYWRIAVEPHWGNIGLNSALSECSSGPSMDSATVTRDDNGNYENQTLPQTDRYTDIAVRRSVPIPGRQLLAHVARHLHSRKPERSTPALPITALSTNPRIP